MSRKTFRLFSILLLLLTAFTAFASIKYFQALAEIQAFPGILLAAEPGKSPGFRPSLASRLFFKARTDGMSAALRALDPESPDEEGLPPNVSEYLSTSLPLPLLMYRSFIYTDFAACLRLASLRQDSPSGLFRSAVALEEGDIGLSRRILESLSGRDRASWLGQRLEGRLDFLEQAGENSSCPVFDGRGTPLGNLLQGRLALLPGLETSAIPAAALAESLTGAGIPEGRGIRVSLVLEIQKIAAEALRGFRGSIVVIDPRGGEILAAVSDPRTLRQDPSAPFCQQYEPASISKLITSSAALRAGIDVDGFMSQTVCTGGKRYSGEMLWCSMRSGRLGTLARALADSCNIAFADLGIRAGRKAVLDELQIFGFDRPPAGPFHFGSILRRSGNDRQLADLSIGLEETTITPVHGALMAAVFANGGIMPEPTLLAASDGLLGISPAQLPRSPGTWVIGDRDSLEIITSAMEEVARNGTGRGVSCDGFPLAMKTGTGRTAGTGYVTNYVGFGPAPAPEIAFCVRITHQSTSSRAGKATREVLSRLVAKLSRTGRIGAGSGAGMPEAAK